MTAVAAGVRDTLFIQGDSLYVLGNDQDGQLGNGPRVMSIGGWTGNEDVKVPQAIITKWNRGYWNQVSLVFEADQNGLGSGKVHRYVNGQPYDSFTDINGTQLTGTELLFGAGSDLNGTSYFAGVIDDLRIYNRSFSVDEMNRLHQLEAPPITPTITAQPTGSFTVVDGGTANFFVNAIGDGLNYQWQKQDANGTWVNIDGATSANYQILNVSASHAGLYRVAITNSNGTSYSDISTLNLVPPPTIPQPSHQIAVVGQIVSFEVNATAGLSYSWQKTDANGSDANSTWTTIADANGSKLTYGPVKLDENGTLFRVNITGGNAPITSQSARLTVRLQQNLAEFQHGLKAFYPFNGNANDEAGGDNNGTADGVSLTTDRNGTAGMAYQFDGTDDQIPWLNNLPTSQGQHSTVLWLTFDEIKALGHGQSQGSRQKYSDYCWTNGSILGNAFWPEFYTNGDSVRTYLGCIHNDWHRVVTMLSGMAVFSKDCNGVQSENH